MVGFLQWAIPTERTPRNRSPSGWRTEGKVARLVEGMPSVSSTGFSGERFTSNELNETPVTSGWMKRCSRRGRANRAGTILLDREGQGSNVLTSQGVVVRPRLAGGAVKRRRNLKNQVS
jgi:hypothetical protein